MAYSISQLTALETALASGQLEVQYVDKKIKYQSTADMMKLRNQMVAELTASGVIAAAVTRTPSTSVAQFSRE